MASIRFASLRSSLSGLSMTAAAAIAGLGLAGCANTPMAQAELAQAAPAAGSCDTNANYSMTGVLHASTKREFDECRRMAQRAAPVTVAQTRPAP